MNKAWYGKKKRGFEVTQCSCSGAGCFRRQIPGITNQVDVSFHVVPDWEGPFGSLQSISWTWLILQGHVGFSFAVTLWQRCFLCFVKLLWIHDEAAPIVVHPSMLPAVLAVHWHVMFYSCTSCIIVPLQHSSLKKNILCWSESSCLRQSCGKKLYNLSIMYRRMKQH